MFSNFSVIAHKVSNFIETLETLQFNTSNSIWPLFMGFSIFFLLFTFYFYLNMSYLIFFGLFFTGLRSFFWFKDLFRERLFKGSQNCFVQYSLKLGIIFFILGEVFFFISFFWAYFHFIFIQGGELGFKWPPKGITLINYLRIPLLNSLLLLSRGFSLTVSHCILLLENNGFKILLFITVLLGLIFSYCQYWEYKILDFLWSDSSYGSIFFIGTGFHGFHVIMGLIILSIAFLRSLFNQILTNSVFFEIRVWYWHFVDVIWIILFTEFYWWLYEF